MERFGEDFLTFSTESGMPHAKSGLGDCLRRKVLKVYTFWKFGMPFNPGEAIYLGK